MAHEKSRKLNSKQLIAANLIGQGLRQKEVATHLNIRGETISRWCKQPILGNVFERRGEN